MKRKQSSHLNKSDFLHANTSLHNGKMTLYEDPIDRDRGAAITPLTYSDNLHPYDMYTSPPLILRSYTSFQSSTTSSNKQQQQHQQQQSQQQQRSNEADNQHYITDSLTKNNRHMKLSMDYIHRLVEQNERRYEQQEHQTTIGHEWQILSRVVDRLLVLIFLLGTMFIFLFIFFQAPLLRLK